jgi:hypothetical protein
MLQEAEKQGRQLMTLKFAWEEKYREALLESGVEGLDKRVDAATNAIEQRVEQLGYTGQGSDDAKRVLRVLTRTECQPGRSTDPVSAQTELAS